MPPNSPDKDASSPFLSKLASPFSPYWAANTFTREASHPNFSPLVGFCFTINYILGTGFLTIPWALAQGGWLLSCLVLIAVGLLSDMSKNYLLETMARAEALLDAKMHWIARPTTTSSKGAAANGAAGGGGGGGEKARLMYSPLIPATTSHPELQGGMVHQISYDALESAVVATTATATLNADGTTTTTTPRTIRRAMLIRNRSVPPRSLVQDRKFEVNTLCRVFLGKTGLRIYTSFICLYIYCTLWAYTSVFASAMAKTLPILLSWNNNNNNHHHHTVEDYEDFSYLVYAIVFAVIVVPISCMELHDQVSLQVALTAARFVMLGLMLYTADQVAHNLTPSDPAYEILPIPAIRTRGISSMVPIMVFAHIFHHSIPGLSHPIADKKALVPVFRATVICCTVLYIWIAIVLATAFGQDIGQSSNLMWNHYQGSGLSSSAWLSKAISWYVVCFPALDVVSAFPLNAITLGNNLLGALYGMRTHEYENNTAVRVRFRLLASVPPIILGIFERQLGRITDYAGTTGFVIGFTFPALLWLKSRSLAESKQASTTTFYTSYASHQGVAWFVLLFGIGMAMYVVVGLARS